MKPFESHETPREWQRLHVKVNAVVQLRACVAASWPQALDW